MKDKSSSRCERKSPAIYHIASQGSRNSEIVNIGTSKICESVVVEDSSQEIFDNYYHKKRPMLNVHKCFDIQVINLLDSGEELETYMKLV